MTTNKPADFTPELLFPADHPRWPGKPRCCAWNRHRGQQCAAPAMTGKRSCSKHGGKTPAGPESPHFKHGARSKYLPKGIRADYESALANPKLLSLHDDIALVDGRLSQIFKAVDAHESPEFVEFTLTQAQEILTALNRYKLAAVVANEQNKDQSLAGMKQALLDIEAAAQALLDQASGSEESAALWKEAYNLIEQRRKLVETEAKINAELRQTITKERALILFGAMVENFRQVVKATVEPEQAREIMLQMQSRAARLIDGQ